LTCKQALAYIKKMSADKSSHPPDRRGSPRERILTAAIELLALHGFDAMTMRQLGDAVGLDNSSLYRHFRNKAELIDAALDHVAGDILSHVEASIDPAQPVTLEVLEAAAARVGLYFFDHPSAARLTMHWFMSMGERGPGLAVSAPAGDMRRPHGKLLELLRSWLRRGIKSGALRKHAEPDAIVSLLGAILLRPATRGFLLTSLEPKRQDATARKAWEAELRAFIRGAFAP
jgi:AcrR family transcriptional regulator